MPVFFFFFFFFFVILNQYLLSHQWNSSVRFKYVYHIWVMCTHTFYMFTHATQTSRVVATNV